MMLRALFVLVLCVFINKYGLCHDHQHAGKPFGEDDNDHLNEHLKEFTNKTADSLTSEEKRFYEFKLHDLNNDNLIDGLELLWLVESSRHDERHNVELIELVETTDLALSMYDKDFNGYLTYSEIHK